MRWKCRHGYSCDAAKIKKLATSLGVPDYVAMIFANRGVDTAEKARKIIDIYSEPLNPPFLFEDMGKAVSRIKKAIDTDEKIVIYGDYDVDGVTAIVILVLMLREKLKHLKTGYYIPHRQDEGYGLNIDALKAVIDSGARLIITIDCGISAKKEAEYCASRNVDLIVTDHHLPGPDTFPDMAYAVINPRISTTYPDKDLSGAGVAYKLACALAEEYKIALKDDYLDFAALGTIADMVPVSMENRMLAGRGMRVIGRTKNPGLKALKNAAKLDPAAAINSYHVGFVLGPRINAAGRIEHANRAVELFLTGSDDEASEIAGELNEVNDERKRMMKKAEEEALSALEKTFNPEKDFVIVIYNQSWNPGILGLVASKILKRYNRPVFALAGDDEGVAHGSARSVKTLDIHEELGRVSGLLERYGGHRLAAGITIRKDKIDLFRRAINENVAGRFKQEDFEPVLEIDAKMEGPISLRDIKIIDNLQPWGEGNPRPVLSLESVEVKDVKFFKNNTMKFYGRKSGKFYNFIMFGHDEADKQAIRPGVLIDVAFCPSINSWQGEESVCLEVEDVKIRAV